MIIQVQNIYLLWDCTQLKDVILLHFNIQQIKLTHFANGFRIDNKKHSGGEVFRLLHPYCLPFVQNRYILLNWKILTPLVCPDKRKWWPSKTASVLKDCHKADRYNVVNGVTVGVSATIQCRRSWLQYCLPDQESGQYCSLQLYHPICGMRPFI